jgi:hypothetical protein
MTDQFRDNKLGGDHARDTTYQGFGGDYAREDHSAPAGARGDFYGRDEKPSDTTDAEVTVEESHIGKASE